MYASTRREELAVTGWPQEQIEAFLSMQFEAQHNYYTSTFTNTTYELILVDDEPAGRLYVGRHAREIRIVDIALLPDYRGRGIGTDLIGELIEEANASGRVVSIHVERENPAMTLYERLGFRFAGDEGPYVLMERPQGPLRPGPS